MRLPFARALALILAATAIHAHAATMTSVKAGRVEVTFDGSGAFRLDYGGTPVIRTGQLYVADKAWARLFPVRSRAPLFTVKSLGQNAVSITAIDSSVNEMTVTCKAEPERAVIEITRKLPAKSLVHYVVTDLYLNKDILLGRPYVLKTGKEETRGVMDETLFRGEGMKGVEALEVETELGRVAFVLGSECPDGAPAIPWRIRNVFERTWGAPELKTFDLGCWGEGIPESGMNQRVSVEVRFAPGAQPGAAQAASAGRGVEALANALAAERKRLGMAVADAPAVPAEPAQTRTLQDKMMRELESLRDTRARGVIPQPQQTTWLKGEFRVGPSARVFVGAQAGAGAQKAAQVIAEELQERFALVLAAPVRDARLPPNGLWIGAEAKAPAANAASLPAEGYELTASPDGVWLCGRDDAGVFYAAQSLAQLVEPARDGAPVVPAVSIRDWPRFAWRGLWLGEANGEQPVEPIKTIIRRIMARYKLNVLVFGYDFAVFRWDHRPELNGRRSCLSMKDLGGLADLARDNFIEFIPAFPSKFVTGLPKDQAAAIVESSDPSLKCNAYCPSNPKSYELIFDLFDQMIQATKPRYFHIVHDEMNCMGLCDKCRGVGNHKLLAQDVTRLRDWLAARNIRAMMCGDMLLEEARWKPLGVQHANSDAHLNTHGAVDLIPRDIIINDWHYEVCKEYPTLAYFREKGFDVVASPWYAHECCYQIAQDAAKAKALGVMVTSWGWLYTLSAAATSLTGMEYAWSSGETPLDALPYDPRAELAARFRPARPSLSPGARFVPADIASAVNARMAAADEGDSASWFGYGPRSDMSLFPTGDARLAGMPFRILPHSGPNCVMIGAKDASPLPQSVERIPLDGRARSVLALVTMTGRNPMVWAQPKAIAVFHYQDGSTVEAVLKESRDMTQWISDTPRHNPFKWTQGYDHLLNARCAWQGFTRSGAAVNAQAWEWVNPSPEKPLSHLSLRVSEEARSEGLKVAVLAVTRVE